MNDEYLDDEIENIRNEQKGGKKKAKKEEPERNIRETYSERFKEGVMLEAVYDPDKCATGLIVCKNGNIYAASEYERDGTVYTAPQSNNSLITTGCLKLPSSSDEYESEKALFEEIRAFIHRYVQLPESFEEVAAWYVLFTWVYDEFRELPYLRAVGDLGCGKSRLLFTVGSLCYRPFFLNGSASVSAIFRIIDEVQGTMVFDEADFRFSDTTSEIIKILNSGFQKGTPVLRSEEQAGSRKKGKSFDPKPFTVFCPKIIATRKNFGDDALESRCLTSPMSTLTRKDVPENLDDAFDEEALAIRNRLLTFRFLKLAKGIGLISLPDFIKVEPRLKQIITPVYSMVEENEGRQSILRFIAKKQVEMEENRFNSMEGELFRSFLAAKEEDKEPTVKDITIFYNREYGGRYEISAKKAGNCIEQIFHLKKRKTSAGFIVEDNEQNERQIERLKIKYGIEKPEMNDVNIVNIDKEPPLTIDDIQREFGLKNTPDNQPETNEDELPF